MPDRQTVTGPLVDANEFIRALNDWYLRLTDSQKNFLEHHMLRYKADMHRHDPATRNYRLRRHWGPARLAARRDRLADR